MIKRHPAKTVQVGQFMTSRQTGGDKDVLMVASSKNDNRAVCETSIKNLFKEKRNLFFCVTRQGSL